MSSSGSYTLQFQAKGESFETTYLMAEEVYAKAVVQNPEKVRFASICNTFESFRLLYG